LKRKRNFQSRRTIVVDIGWLENLNMKVGRSWFGKLFRLEFSGHRKERKGSRFSTEIRAGIATYVDLKLDGF